MVTFFLYKFVLFGGINLIENAGIGILGHGESVYGKICKI